MNMKAHGHGCTSEGTNGERTNRSAGPVVHMHPHVRIIKYYTVNGLMLQQSSK
jgi:hypothetical protein